MQDQNTSLNLTAGAASVCIALVLVVAKLWALGETQSLSVAATLADSALDLMMSAGGLWAIAYAAKPADDDHAFGHSSAEDLATLGQSLFILVSAGVILWSAIARLLSHNPPALEQEARGVAVMLLSIALTIGLVVWQRRVVSQTGSKVVAADSMHYLGDLLPNIGAILALWVSSHYGLRSIDSLVAIAAALILALGALRIGKGAWDALMDRATDPAIIAGIEQITRDFPGVRGFHDLKTRQAGSRTFVNLHVELDGAQSLDDAHAIGAALRRAILAKYPRTDVLIHKDPYGVEPHPDDPQKDR